MRYVAVVLLLLALLWGVGSTMYLVVGCAAIVLRRLGLLKVEDSQARDLDVDGPGVWIGRQTRPK